MTFECKVLVLRSVLVVIRLSKMDKLMAILSCKCVSMCYSCGTIGKLN